MDKVEDPREVLFLDLIDGLERNYLQKKVPDTLQGGSATGRPAVQLIKILGISQALSQEKKLAAERYLMEDVLSGLYSQSISLLYFIRGQSHSIDIYTGVQINAAGIPNPEPLLIQQTKSLITSLEGTYPNIGISIDKNHAERQDLELFLQKAQHHGILTGIPTPKVGSEGVGIEQIERLIRALFGEEWGYLVIADPVPSRAIHEIFQMTMGEIREKSEQVKSTVSSGTPYGQETKEVVNRAAQHYVELLEHVVERYTAGKAQGMWNVAVYYCSPSSATFEKMGALLTSIFSGETSQPDTIRTHRCPPGLKSIIQQFRQVDAKSPVTEPFLHRLNPFMLTTILSSGELGTFVHLPKEEMPGYDVRKSVRYGVCIPHGMSKGEIEVGDVIDRGKSTGNPLSIPKDLLTKHGLVVGVTGSGKTNTCFHLLMQLWTKSKVPFLVIEPTKGEYRGLIEALRKAKINLRVFTLGNETVSPFRMNPFEVPEGVFAQRHLDNLKAIFNASFTMYPPMPFVLEHCLVNIYEKNGWNLAHNIRGRTPTLGDLYAEIDTVVRGLGYHAEVSMNVRAGLKTRIRSLMLGGKGRMLNCEHSIPIEEILEKPTVIELKGIGDDEEKAFLMGILLGNLYEFREAHGNVPRLQHITLIEEAHRLLANVARGSAEESSQSKAKAVETLCNILTEVRAYGEGILIADQVPTKLAPDAIKNTNIKIVHRTIAGDDREVLAQAIGLTDVQKDYLINLGIGRAVVFMERLDEPFLVQVPPFPGGGTAAPPSDSELKTHMGGYYKKFPDAIRQLPPPPFHGCDACDHRCEYRFMVEPLVNDEDLQKGILKTFVEGDESTKWKLIYSQLSNALQKIGYQQKIPDLSPRILCIFIQIMNQLPPAGDNYYNNLRDIIKKFKDLNR
jgi:hypothetical protein